MRTGFFTLLALIISTCGTAFGQSKDTPAVILKSVKKYDSFASDVTSVGDLNGDGYADLVGGAKNYSQGQGSEGALYVWYGSASSMSGAPDVIIESNQAYAALGTSVTSEGDLNGDGYADLVAGAPGSGSSKSENDSRGLYVWYGSASGVSGAPDMILGIEQQNAVLGRRLTSAGDLNGDGYADLVAGASAYQNGQTMEGALIVWYGSAKGLSGPADVILESNHEFNTWGFHPFTSAGDVNGDGYADLVSCDPSHDEEYLFEGSLHVWYGSSSGISGEPSVTLAANHKLAKLGDGVVACDLNADGYADLVGGASKYEKEGALLVWYGSSSGVSGEADVVLASHAYGSWLGSGVSSGDLNADGYADLVGMGYGYRNEEYKEGALLVWHGSSNGVSGEPDLILESKRVEASLGHIVSGGGDLNGDGYADLVSGGKLSEGEEDVGALFLFFGAK